LTGDRRDGGVVRPARATSEREQAEAIPSFGGKPAFQRDEERIPIVEEQVTVGKREVETGRVRVHTVVDEEQLNCTELLERDIVEIERVPVGREVAQAPLPFEEGDVLVIPVIEERLVVEKRLVVVEEVRIRRRQVSEESAVPVTRRVMRAEIERTAPTAPPPGPAPSVAEPAFARSQSAPLRSDPTQFRAGVAPRPGPQASPLAAGPRQQVRPEWVLIGLGLLALLLVLIAWAGRG
jgi:uncharacterized protein (TIGR02271 family)